MTHPAIALIEPRAIGRAAPGNRPQKPRRPLAEVLDLA